MLVNARDTVKGVLHGRALERPLGACFVSPRMQRPLKGGARSERSGDPRPPADTVTRKLGLPPGGC